MMALRDSLDVVVVAARGLYSSPPDAQSRQDVNPTLLLSWWATGFALVIILVRVVGRFVRTERLFADDWTMALSIVPLLARMGFIHVVLLYGTNNASPTEDVALSPHDIHLREMGSRLVLPARIFYALFIWTAKLTVADFLGRIISQIWRNSFRHFLRTIRYFLAITFAGVVVATLTECQPFNHYWQVVPDPGPKCRQGYAQLITMGVCDVLTDLLLVIFPVPVIHLSAMPVKRKISLWILFGLSVVLVAITCYRVPSVINRHGSQQYRSLIASLEILAAAATSNAVVIGSYVRDRGVKKHKFKTEKSASVGESVGQASFSRRATVTQHQWGSDEDLAGDIGMRLDPEQYPSSYAKIRPAPVAAPPWRSRSGATPADRGSVDPNWQFSRPNAGAATTTNSNSNSNTEDDHASSTGSLAADKTWPREYISTSGAKSPSSRVSLNDVGGLLEPHPSPKTKTVRYSSAGTPSSSSQGEKGLDQQASSNLPELELHSSMSDGPYMSGGRSVSQGDSSSNSPRLPAELMDAGGLLKPNRR